MAGTPQETVAYVIGSGKPGPVVLVLGGVHGDEPGGWLAAERVTDLRPNAGALIVIPRANRQAILTGTRTTPELGDLNRLYPGDPSAVGGPMARMAAEIVGLIEQYQVDAVLDLHESWGFYQDRPSRSTAFLGQTISAFPNERGVVLGEAVVAAVNARINDPAEEMAYREYPPRTPAAVATAAPGQAVEEATPIRAGGTASLGLGSRFPNMAVLLVEMAQQLPLERRVALHVEVVEQVLQALGMQ